MAVRMRSKRKQGLTAGEVSKMLGRVISRSTVIKYFDRGILTGWKHPVTGRMFIDPASVKTLKLIWRRSKPSSGSSRTSSRR